jgi:hypothetical protein
MQSIAICAATSQKASFNGFSRKYWHGKMPVMGTIAVGMASTRTHYIAPDRFSKNIALRQYAAVA